MTPILMITKATLTALPETLPSSEDADARGGVAFEARGGVAFEAQVSRPSGFVARCRCGAIVGAADATRTDLGRMLGRWLFAGCTVEPRWGSWHERIEPCSCRG